MIVIFGKGLAGKTEDSWVGEQMLSSEGLGTSAPSSGLSTFSLLPLMQPWKLEMDF